MTATREVGKEAIGLEGLAEMAGVALPDVGTVSGILVANFVFSYFILITCTVLKMTSSFTTREVLLHS